MLYEIRLYNRNEIIRYIEKSMQNILMKKEFLQNVTSK